MEDQVGKDLSSVSANTGKNPFHAIVAIERREIKNFEYMFNDAPEIACFLLGVDHVILTINPAYTKVLGFDATGMLARQAQPEDENFLAILDQVFTTGNSVTMLESPILLKGRARYFSLTISAHRNYADEIDGLIVIGSEVTDAVLRREVLKLQKDALELALANQPIHDVLSVMTQMVELQAGGTLIASVLLADLARKRLLFGAAPGLPKEYNDAIHGIAIGPNVGSCGTAAYTKLTTIVANTMTDERWKDFRVLAEKFGLHACWSVPIFSSSHELLGTFAFYSRTPREPTDWEIQIVEVAAQTTALILEQRNEAQGRLVAVEAAEAANSAKSAFLANMSHEIRTPIGAIMGFADLAREPSASTEEVASYLAIVERNSVQVLRIINDILDLAKVEAGRIEFENIEVFLTAFLADVMSLLGFRARENGITLNLRAETDLPELVISDPTRLRQILTNAVGNAIKFTKSGSVTVHVCLKKDVLFFGIEDTGRGISDTQAKGLFQAFSQADVSTTREFGGTGLGLVLTKKLCQLMGGDYLLERSELGKGSKFEASVKVEIPSTSRMIDRNEVVFKTKTDSRADAEVGRLGGLSVLLVEDSPDNQTLVRLFLEKQGVQLKIVGDGLAGFNEASREHFDVVLMDIQMPGMDGHEVTRKLRQNGYTKPIVALTAHAMKEESERAQRSGFTTFLSKPIRREDLIATVAKLGMRS